MVNQIPREVLEAWAQKHPWMRKHFFPNKAAPVQRRPGGHGKGQGHGGHGKGAPKGSSSSAGGASSSVAPPAPPAPDPVEEAAGEPEEEAEADEETRLRRLRELREQWRWDEDAPTDFYPHMNPGRARHHAQGLASDCVQAFSRGGMPKMWARAYGWPLSPSWTYTEHNGEENCMRMAREFCRKSLFFYSMWFASDDDDFDYSDDQINSYDPSHEFMEWALEQLDRPSTRRRIDELLALKPWQFGE